MALNSTMEILTTDLTSSESPLDDIPVSDPSGGLITTDLAEVVTLLANRVSALETAVSELQRPAPTPTNPAPEPDPEPTPDPAPEDTEPPADDTPEDDTTTTTTTTTTDDED